jgi:hypothetical protein
MQKNDTHNDELHDREDFAEFSDVDLNSSASQLDRDVKSKNTESSNKTKLNNMYQLFQQITKNTSLPEGHENPSENNMEDKTESGIGENCTCKEHCCIL